MTVTVETSSGDTEVFTIARQNGNTDIVAQTNIKYEGITNGTYDVEKLLVKEGTVFVMGDNRSHSTDSRDARIGLVDTRRILGKVIFRIAPLSRMGTVK